MRVGLKKVALIAAGLCGLLAVSAANAVLITVESFTGDDAKLNVEIIDNAPSGVSVSVTFAVDSTYTGDITGVWLGLDDLLFDPNTIQVADVIVGALPDGVTYSVSIGDDLTNLGGGVNLEGEAGFVIQFDLDLALSQNDPPPGNTIIASLMFDIVTAGLTESVFNAAGVRLQSTNGPAGSSKLAGGVTTAVPEPGSLALLGAGLIGLGLLRRRSIMIW